MQTCAATVDDCDTIKKPSPNAILKVAVQAELEKARAAERLTQQMAEKEVKLSSTIRDLKAECQALLEKRLATDEDREDRIVQSKTMEERLRANAAKSRSTLEEKKRKAADMERACGNLRAEVSAFEKEEATLTARITLLWAELVKVRDASAVPAEVAKAMQSGMVLPMRDEQQEQDLKDRQALKTQRIALEQDANDCARTLSGLKERRHHLDDRLQELAERSEFWRALQASYGARAEAANREAEQIKEEYDLQRQKHSVRTPTVNGDGCIKAGDAPSKEDAELQSAAQELLHARRLRQAASVSPIAASWVVCLWWLLVRPQLQPALQFV